MRNHPKPGRLAATAAPAPASDPSTDIVVLPPPPDVRQDGWTPSLQARFLRELASTHCVSRAARAVGKSRQSAYKLRNRLKGEPFDIAWQCAFQRQFDALAQAAVERALHGVEVPHFHKGELVHVSRRFDERLTIALLALRDRIAPAPRSYYADDEGIATSDFEGLVDRVEHGDELWMEVEHAGEGDGEGEATG